MRISIRLSCGSAHEGQMATVMVVVTVTVTMMLMAVMGSILALCPSVSSVRDRAGMYHTYTMFYILLCSRLFFFFLVFLSLSMVLGNWIEISPTYRKTQALRIHKEGTLRTLSGTVRSVTNACICASASIGEPTSKQASIYSPQAEGKTSQIC